MVSEISSILAAKSASISMSVVGLVALGFMAQTHCLLMCGPIAATLKKPKLYTVGRTLSYGGLGAAFATLGEVLTPNPTYSLIFASLIAFLVIGSLLKLPALSLLAQFSARAGSMWRPLTRFQNPNLSALMIGLGTPLLPCGQFWSVMGFASLSGSWALGAFVGAGFALFTSIGILSFQKIKDKAIGFGLSSSSTAMAKKGESPESYLRFASQTALTSIFLLITSAAAAQFFWTSYARSQHVHSSQEVGNAQSQTPANPDVPRCH